MLLSRVPSLKQLVSIGLSDKIREIIEGGPPECVVQTFYTLFAEKMQLQKLQRQLEFMGIQESYIKDETKNLRRELIRAKDEVKRIQSVPLVIGQFLELSLIHISEPTRPY